MVLSRRCPGCSEPVAGVRSSPLGLCSRCLERLEQFAPVGWVRPPEGVDALAILARYRPPVPGLVVAAKNGGRRHLLHAFGRSLAPFAAASAASPGQEWVVTWVPAGRKAKRRRGYDQGRVLANGLGRAAGLPARRLLVRRYEAARSGADRLARMQGPAVRAPIGSPPRVLLVDDVVTTGSSMRVCAEALRRAGATEVVGMAIAASGRGWIPVGPDARQAAHWQ